VTINKTFDRARALVRNFIGIIIVAFLIFYGAIISVC